ncbi:MAG TPA: 16S rRNA (cytosine(1402)-N(4))-methyltransferase [bacterium]|nr:16S rRNA (cytosine(1402)-N(4))-methyltransferase [bacterium]HEX68345.1 16S rRNA (cytosine(1402)-N(4))-methyltransferase [bacterium]
MVSETVVHFPVMVEEVIKILVWKEDGVYFDGTVGEGGHARALLERFPRLKIIGLDWDEEILKVAEDNLREFHDRVILKQAN